MIGGDAHVHLRVGDDSALAWVPAQGRPSAGESVRVTVRAEDLHVFDFGSGSRVEWP